MCVTYSRVSVIVPNRTCYTGRTQYFRTRILCCYRIADLTRLCRSYMNKKLSSPQDSSCTQRRLMFLLHDSTRDAIWPCDCLFLMSKKAQVNCELPSQRIKKLCTAFPRDGSGAEPNTQKKIIQHRHDSDRTNTGHRR